MKKLFVTALAAAMGVTGLGIGATASAGPIVPAVSTEANSNLIQVQGDGRWGRANDQALGQDIIIRRGDRRFNGRHFNRRDSANRGGFYVQGGQGWYNGHRG